MQQPIAGNEGSTGRDRIAVIDSIRALAIIGVIVIHVTGMVMSYRGQAVLAAADTGDIAWAFFDLGLVIDKARACFGFLFGVSFGILLDRAGTRGGGFAGFYGRRMAGLLMIGLANQAFLFFGDILTTYAVVGAALTLFRRWSDRGILRLGLALIALDPAVQAAAASIGAPLWAWNSSPSPWAATARAAYDGPSFAGVVSSNLAYPLQRWRHETLATALWTANTLGLFLVGYWWSRRGIFGDIAGHRRLLVRLAAIGLPFGLLLSGIGLSDDLRLVTNPPLTIAAKAAGIGAPVLAIGYIALAALLFTDRGGPGQRLLAPLGRISLTAYLANAAIAGPILYGYGLGRGATIDLKSLNFLALGIAAALIVFAHLWLARCRYGPLEWLWRSFSRWHPQPLLR